MRAPLDVVTQPGPAPRASDGPTDRAAVLDAAKAGRHELAARLARELIAGGAQDPVLHDMVAFQHRRAGDFAAAAVELAKVVALDPENPMAAANFAVCLARCGRREEALAQCNRVAASEPLAAQVEYGLGVALQALGRLEDARARLERVVAAEPGHVAALGSLAHMAFWNGELEAARDYAERALEARPGALEAEIVLARLEASGGDLGPLKGKVSALLRRSDLAFENRASLLILLGDALDGEGDYRGAFDAYRAGKAQLRALFLKNHGAPFDGALAMAEHVVLAPETALAGARPPARRGRQAGEPERHIVLLGFPRSGTTLLEQVLASRRDAVDLEERETFAAIEPEVFGDARGLERLAALDEPALEGFRAAYWKSVREHGVEPEGKLFVDKNPFWTLRLPLIAALFPHAKVLFAVRDPRDVVLSCFRRNFHMAGTTWRFSDLVDAARYYDTTMRAAERYRAGFRFDLYEARYEALVADFDAETRAICAFLEIEWTAEMRAFAEKARERRVRSLSSAQVQRGLYANAAGHWRNYRDQLAPVLPILAPWVERFGYPAD